MEPKRNLPSCIYFLSAPSAGLVKIGCTGITVEKRVQQHRGGSPVPLELLASAPGTIDDERAIHAALLAHHSHFEWFRMAPKVMSLIAFVSETGSIPAHMRGFEGQRNPLNGIHLQARHRSTVTRWENGTASIPKPILLLIDQMESSAPTPSSSEAA